MSSLFEQLSFIKADSRRKKSDCGLCCLWCLSMSHSCIAQCLDQRHCKVKIDLQGESKKSGWQHNPQIGNIFYLLLSLIETFLKSKLFNSPKPKVRTKFSISFKNLMNDFKDDICNQIPSPVNKHQPLHSRVIGIHTRHESPHRYNNRYVPHNLVKQSNCIYDVHWCPVVQTNEKENRKNHCL